MPNLMPKLSLMPVLPQKPRVSTIKYNDRQQNQ